MPVVMPLEVGSIALRATGRLGGLGDGAVGKVGKCCVMRRKCVAGLKRLYTHSFWVSFWVC